MISFSPPEPTHVCATPDCANREWNVERDTDARDLWYLRGRRGAFTMASSRAVCPICGGALLEIATLEPISRPAHRVEAELTA
jgi:hypothetical protein